MLLSALGGQTHALGRWLQAIKYQTYKDGMSAVVKFYNQSPSEPANDQ